ncbi:MAG: hypothetical protein HUU38_20750 [Anaerolineales bacterium]|nr:hypothetical protein [Anaerolineales bacterium]
MFPQKSLPRSLFTCSSRLLFSLSPFLLFIFLTACATNPPATHAVYLPLSSSASDDLARAAESLNKYFNALHAGQYEQAIAHYGGSYEVLQGYNPELNPDDHAALFKNGCEFNGLQCKPIKTLVEQTEVSPTEFHFLVEFQNDDGSLFVLGPCCGATEEEMPPVSQFEYTVIKSAEGAFLVQELPVYVP